MGNYSEVTLAEARTRGAEARKDAAVGADPIERRHHGATDAATAAMTFSKAAEKYIDAKRHEWSNEKHADQWRNTLATYAAPIIGHLPVADIRSQHAQQILSPIWTIKHATATRVRGRIEQVLSWSGVMGYRPKGHNLAAWNNNLEHTLANPSKLNAAKFKHHAALPIDDMSAFWQRLCHSEWCRCEGAEVPDPDRRPIQRGPWCALVGD